MKVCKEKTRDQERFVYAQIRPKLHVSTEQGKTSSITLHCVLLQYGIFLGSSGTYFLAPGEAMFNISRHIHVAYNENAEVFFLPPPPLPPVCARYAIYKS